MKVGPKTTKEEITTYVAKNGHGVVLVFGEGVVRRLYGDDTEAVGVELRPAPDAVENVGHVTKAAWTTGFGLASLDIWPRVMNRQD